MFVTNRHVCVSLFIEQAKKGKESEPKKVREKHRFYRRVHRER
jgi:hypothetical protein